MAIANIMLTGRSGMQAAKAAIATSGHNISNANTEGFSRQRVQTETNESRGGEFGHNTIGTGTRISRVERLNDQYIEKQVRIAGRDMALYEEKDAALRQVEDIFNEMNGDGLNRLVARFFNEFRKLSDQPESPAIRQSVREASHSMVNDFHRLRTEVEDVRRHLDAKIEGYISEANALGAELADLNLKIREVGELQGPPNDLLDKRDLVLKKLNSFFDISMHPSKFGDYNVDMVGVGPLVGDGASERLEIERSPADGEGKPEQAFDIRSTGNVQETITHQIQGGKLGALLEVRDVTLSAVLERLDEMAYSISTGINEIHRQGFGLNNKTNIDFFNPISGQERASEFISLSNEILTNANSIATAAQPDAPGDNRVALAIAGLQNAKIMDEGFATLDEYYNSIVGDVGVVTSKNRFAMNQQKDIVTQLSKVRDQISGVSIDEETTNLLQFQHIFDASAKVIQIADDMLKTVLAIKRD